ncbi:hypothetical protein BUALT_Bualt13G0117500 [Buddleja alternifolia]|uniref:G3BP-like protein n=1 Tax=Buddleja alternifolia TaxID=168488 RepID=A0AAV6WS62_9LAMI|nr:hypothetical protein BUALT_Bualt13G0117500 [Buddleja alternifolia]
MATSTSIDIFIVRKPGRIVAATPRTCRPSTTVGNAFVQQYYHILHHSPGLVHRFYQDISKLGRPEDDGSMSITTTMQAINEKIVSLNYVDFRAEIKSVDAQESFSGGVNVLVTGYLTGKDSTVRNFTQSFFLAPQDRGYFVLNDMFRYVDNVDPIPVLVSDVVVPIAAEPIPAPVQENHVSEENTPSAEETAAGEVYNPSEDEDVPITEEEVPVAEVVDEVQDDAQMLVESSGKIEEVPKKSYASIVMHLKENAASFSPPPAASRKAPPKKVEQVNPTFVPAPDGPISSSESVDNEHNQEADGYSIYIKGLPMNATDAALEEVFKKFGTIKSDGIQVRSNKLQGFCFGFVEFEDASSVQKALEVINVQTFGKGDTNFMNPLKLYTVNPRVGNEASPVLIGGRHAVIEEKRSTSSRGNNRGRFQYGRGSGFRNDGVRGRGNYGGGRGGYYRGGDFNGRSDFVNRGGNGGDLNGRSDFVNRGGNRGGASNRDGYQRVDRMNRPGGMANANAKNMTPRVSATA